MIIFSCYIHVRNDVEIAGYHLYVLIMGLISKMTKTLIYVMLSVHENARVYFTSIYIFLDSTREDKNNPEGRSTGPTFGPPASGNLPLGSGQKSGPRPLAFWVFLIFPCRVFCPYTKICFGFLWNITVCWLIKCPYFDVLSYYSCIGIWVLDEIPSSTIWDILVTVLNILVTV